MMYVVGPLSVGRANLKMNDLCGGVPSPGGFLGFVGATARRLGLDGWNVSVLPIIHDLYVHPGRIRPGVKGGPVQPLEVPEDVNGSIVATLLVNLPEEVPEDDVMTAVMSGRLCGGDVLAKDHRIRREGKARIARSEDGEVMRGIPRGYAVIPATETSRLPITNGGDDGLADLLDILHPEDGQRRELGFLIPIAAGYRLIEEPVGAGQRRGVRDVSTRHAFAEPLMSIGEMVSVRNPRLTSLDDKGLREISWRWNVAGQYRTFSPLFTPSSSRQEEESS